MVLVRDSLAGFVLARRVLALGVVGNVPSVFVRDALPRSISSRGTFVGRLDREM